MEPTTNKSEKQPTNPNLINELRAKRSIVFDESNNAVMVMKIYTYADSIGTNPALARKNMIDVIRYSPNVKVTQMQYEQKTQNQFHAIPMKAEYFILDEVLNQKISDTETLIGKLYCFSDRAKFITVSKKTFADSEDVLFELHDMSGDLFSQLIQYFHQWQNFYFALFGEECGIPEKF